jgi:hypothetical protein
MSSTKPPIIIVDSNLVDERGHHLALARTISASALSKGHSVVWYTHRKFDRRMARRDIMTVPAFSRSIYEVFAAKRSDIDLSPEYLSVLASILEKYRGRGCVILMHSADAHVYRALRGILPDLVELQPAEGGTRGIEFHVCTPYELSLMPGSAVPAQPVERCLLALARSPACEKSLFFWAQTDRLAEYYRRVLRVPVTTLSLPAPHWADPDATMKRAGLPLRLAFLGAAREEKGFHKLPGLVERISSDAELRDAVILDVQSTAPMAGYSKVAEAALRTLEKYEKLVRLVPSALSAGEYAAMMNASDAVLVFYSAKNYFARGSGIVIEALSCGKYIIGQRGMFVDDMRHLGMALMGNSEDEWISSIRDLVRHIDTRRAQARLAGRQFSIRSSPSLYVESLLMRKLLRRHCSDSTVLGSSLRSPLLVHPSNSGPAKQAARPR